MLYIIDGHNFIHSSHFKFSQENSLYEFIEIIQNIANSDPKKKFQIIFDGFPPKNYSYKTLPQHKNLKVTFSLDEDADAIIKRKLDLITNKNETTLVTNDREIQVYAKNLDIQISSIIQFEKFLQQRLE